MLAILYVRKGFFKMNSSVSVRPSVILVAFLFLVEGAFAQGFLGRVKQGVVDAAKETVNEAVNQTVPTEAPKNAVNPQTPIPKGGVVDGKQADNDAAEAKRKAEDEAFHKEMQAAEDKRKADAEDLNKSMQAAQAKRKEDEARLMAEQKAQRKKMQEEAAAAEFKRKTEAQDEILNELRAGNITAKNAKDQLEQRQLWQEDMGKKLDSIVAERMAELEKNKFPLADMFKTPVKMYNEFESGLSKEWCKAKLEAEDILDLVNTGSINVKTKEGAVILVFKKPISEKPLVLTACVVELAPSIRHAQVLEKYKNELPDATVKHEAKQLETPKGNNYLMAGISLDMQFSMTRQTDILTSASKTVTIESNLLVGKAFLVYHNSNQKVVVCESSKDGTVTVPGGLNAQQQEAAATVKDQMLAGVQKVTVLIEDTAMAKALQDLQKAEQENEKKKQQQKNAEALAF